MLIVVLVIYLLILFVIGYYVMGKLDDFFALPDPLPDAKQTMNIDKTFVLLFGFGKLADKLIKLLEKYNIDYIQIEDENFLDRKYNYSHLFAISENDLSNLLICAIANKTMDIHKKVAICNTPNNINIFEQNNLHYFNVENITAEVLFNSMFSDIFILKESNDD